MKKYFVLFFLPGLFHGSVFAQISENCSLRTPPRSAAVNAVHGAFIFIYPRNVTTNYSGCQTLWDQEGKTLAKLRFSGGELVSWEEFELSQTTPSVTCLYKARSLTSQSQECPAYEDVESGFGTLPLKEESTVPADKDPRSKR